MDIACNVMVDGMVENDNVEFKGWLEGSTGAVPILWDALEDLIEVI